MYTRQFLWGRGEDEAESSRPKRGWGSRKTASRCLRARQLPRGIHHWQ